LFAFASAILTVVLITLPFYALSVFQAAVVSLIIALLLLFWLGRYVGKISLESPLKYGVMYVFIGLLAAGIAFLVGEGLKVFLL
jgi:predicted membrane protein (TIGR00267 family)